MIVSISILVVWCLIGFDVGSSQELKKVKIEIDIPSTWLPCSALYSGCEWYAPSAELCRRLCGDSERPDISDCIPDDISNGQQIHPPIDFTSNIDDNKDYINLKIPITNMAYVMGITGVLIFILTIWNVCYWNHKNNQSKINYVEVKAESDL